MAVKFEKISIIFNSHCWISKNQRRIWIYEWLTFIGETRYEEIWKITWWKIKLTAEDEKISSLNAEPILIINPKTIWNCGGK